MRTNPALRLILTMSCAGLKAGAHPAPSKSAATPAPPSKAVLPRPLADATPEKARDLRSEPVRRVR